MGYDIKAGSPALNSVEVPDSSPGSDGTTKVSAATFLANHTAAVTPNHTFPYAWRGSTIMFYAGKPKEVHPALKSRLLAEGLVS